MFVNGLDDTFILFSAYMSFSVHMDIYSAALFAGKCFKIAFQYYIEGFFFQYMNDPVESYKKPEDPVVKDVEKAKQAAAL